MIPQISGELRRYTFEELRRQIPAPPPVDVPPLPPAARNVSGDGLNILDTLNDVEWRDILPASFERVSDETIDGRRVERYRRDGATSAYSLKCWPSEGAYVWSDAIPGLPAGQYSKAAVIAGLCDVSVRELSQELTRVGYGATSTLPVAQAVIDAARRRVSAYDPLHLIAPSDLTVDDSADDETLPLGLRLVREVCAEVDAMPPPRWLWTGIWPQGKHGVLGAEPKLGKTWMAIDAAVSAAAGSPWLGRFEPQITGPVIYFAGEGGAQGLTRRSRAVATHYGHTWDELDIYFSETVPTLTIEQNVDDVKRAVGLIRPVLVIIDPLYFAAGGADHTSLYEMGQVLRPIQAATQQFNAALMIVHHFNRDTSKKDAGRFSGAGPAEWGRVLISATKNNSTTDDETGCSEVDIALTVVGDEVSGGKYAFRRQVRAENISDLASPMHYWVAPLDGTEPTMKAPKRRVFTALSHIGDWATRAEVQAELLKTGEAMSEDTVRNHLNALVHDGLAVVEQSGNNGGKKWRLRDSGNEATDAT